MKYTHNYMKIFLDTADTGVIEKYFSTGLVDGVTTNPTLIMKSGRILKRCLSNNQRYWCPRH